MGFGAIGVELAKRLRPFGVKIIATKRRWSLNSAHLDCMMRMSSSIIILCANSIMKFLCSSTILLTNICIRSIKCSRWYNR